MPEPEGSKLQNSNKIKIIIALVTIILIVLMFPKGESIESEVSVGSIWMNDDLIAPFSFPVYKDPEVYKAELQVAAASVYPVFIKDEEKIQSIFDSLKNYDNYLLKMVDSSLKSGANQNINPTFLTASSFNTFENLRRQERNMLAKQNQSIKRLFSIVESVISDIYRTGVLDESPSAISKDSIAVRTGNVDRIEPVDKFLDLANAKKEVGEEIKNWNFSTDVEEALTEYANHFIEPNIIFSHNLTKEEIDQAEKNVSKYSGIVTENERIIGKKREKR